MNMARITVEDCLEHVENMYALILMATKRARQLYRGADPLVKSKNRVIVTALREIAAGKVVGTYTGPGSSAAAQQEQASSSQFEDDELPH